MSDYSKNIIYLSDAQRYELFANGSITVDGVTVTYDENDIYVTPQAEPVTDVRVNGISVAANGVANIPVASTSVFGAVKISSGLYTTSNGELRTNGATVSVIKNGLDDYRPIASSNINAGVFYGLAKASGDTTQSQSSNAVGSYTPEAKAAIQSMLGVSDLIAPAENTLVASKAYAIGDVFTANGKLYKATAAIAANDSIVLQNSGETVSGANAVETNVGEGFPHDVQMNGVSVVSNGVANLPLITSTTPGIAKVDQYSAYGINVRADGTLQVVTASDAQVKSGSIGNDRRPITPSNQHASAFYGLAKAAGDTTQAASDNAVGTYTDNAKASIKSMLGIVDGSTGTVDVSGTTPAITAVENTRYVCGEVSTLSFTPPASGISIVRFTSGTTATVLTLPSTVKFPEWFDSTTLETDTIYEICITDGIYGAVMSWSL